MIEKITQYIIEFIKIKVLIIKILNIISVFLKLCE